MRTIAIAPTRRDQRLRDMLASIKEWRRASGPDREYWRRRALDDTADFRRWHLIPERAAFQLAVARSKLARAA